jgi:type IV pilus assembly protein PilN
MTPIRMPGFLQLSARPARSGHSPSAEALVPPALDLLRERRRSFGQLTIWPLLEDRRSLVLQGASIGAVVVGVVIAITGLVFLRLQLIKAEIGRYSQVESQYANLTTQLGDTKRKLDAIAASNNELIGKLTNVRPTSALLSDLQLRVPAGIQLLSATTADTTLTLKGVADDPSAFAKINALQLELRRSPLFDPQSISLTKIERTANGSASTTDDKNQSGAQFTIAASFATLRPRELQQVLTQLGSAGMARRLEVIQREGLLP